LGAVDNENETVKSRLKPVLRYEALRAGWGA